MRDYRLLGNFGSRHGLELIRVEKDEEDEDYDEIVEMMQVNPDHQLHEF